MKPRVTFAWFGLLSFIVGTTGVLGAAPEKISLRLNLKPGQTFKYRIDNTTKMTNTVGASTSAVETVVSVVYSFEVQSVENADYTLKVTYDSLKLREVGPLGNVSGDSSKPAESHALVKGILGVVGQSFTLRVGQDGRVRSVQGCDEITRTASRELDTLAEPWKSAMTQLLGDHFGNAAVRESMRSLFDIYPEKPVAVGERWSRSEITSKGKIDAFFKITERKDGRLSVKLYQEVTADPNAIPVQMGLLTVKSAVSGKSEGTMLIEEVTGLILKGSVSGKVSGSVKVIQGSNETAVPTSIEGTTSIERI